jgi:glycine C-acetyltransferase
LGLSSHEVVQAAKDALDTWIRNVISAFYLRYSRYPQNFEKKNCFILWTEDTILYAAAFDANGEVFEPLLGEDAIISDSLNHASIIDGVRLCKASRYRYENSNMEDLEQQLIKANEAGSRLKSL